MTLHDIGAGEAPRLDASSATPPRAEPRPTLRDYHGRALERPLFMARGGKLARGAARRARPAQGHRRAAQGGKRLLRPRDGAAQILARDPRRGNARAHQGRRRGPALARRTLRLFRALSRRRRAPALLPDETRGRRRGNPARRRGARSGRRIFRHRGDGSRARPRAARLERRRQRAPNSIPSARAR